MSKRKIVLLIFRMIIVLMALIILYLYVRHIISEAIAEEYFAIKSANLTYEGRNPVLYIRMVNTGEVSVKIVMVHLCYEEPTVEHYVGASAFVEETKQKVLNPLIVLYGSNPIPPKQEAVFKAKLSLSAKYID